MPRLGREDAARGPIVQGYAAGGFSVDGEVYRALQLTPTQASAWEAPETAAGLTMSQFEALLSAVPEPEFLLLGTGHGLAQPPRALREALEARGIGLEAMDSRAAARTWGVLRAEERWIVAALMPL